jgi:hypothetical protein
MGCKWNWLLVQPNIFLPATDTNLDSVANCELSGDSWNPINGYGECCDTGKDCGNPGIACSGSSIMALDGNLSAWYVIGYNRRFDTPSNAEQ